MKNKRKFLNDRTGIIAVIIIFVIVAVGHTYYSYLGVQKEQKKFALAESKILNDFMFLHRDYYQKLFLNKTIKLDENTLKALPAFSAFPISQSFSQNNEYKMKVQTVSDRARNPKNQADEEELKAIEYFSKNQDAKEYFEFIDKEKDPYFQYGFALRIDKTCLSCHSTKDKAPKFIAQTYDNAYGYKIGEVRGIISVKIPKEHTHDYVHDRFINNTIFNLATLVFILISAILILTKRAKDIEILNEEKIKAQSANKAKSEFLANMSHEIRTPLNAILGFVEFLKDEEVDSNKLKYLNTIDKSSHSLLGVINDILDFSKIESGKLEIDKINFNPIEEFESISALFCAKAEEKNLCFNVEIDSNIPKVIYSDPLRLKQVLSNLLSNAIKFSKQNGQVELKMKYFKEINSIRFSVIDDGIGISKEYQENIFTPFTQEQSSTTRNYGGTGLGLTISFKLLSILGSQLKIVSEVGAGSEFYFDLYIENRCPLYENKDLLIKEDYIKNIKVATVFSKKYGSKKVTIKKYLNILGVKNIQEFEALEVSKLKNKDVVMIDCHMFNHEDIQNILNENICVIIIKTTLSGSLISNLKGRVHELECPINISDLYDIYIDFFSNTTKNKYIDINKTKNINFNAHVLLVEDNKANQMFMNVVLKKFGLTFDIASDGIEAIDMFNRNRYDIILMDENMPNMGGIEATQNILAIEKEKKLLHTPIIALTANALKGDRERFIKAGMDEYLTKPLNKNILAEVLNKFLGDKDV